MIPQDEQNLKKLRKQMFLTAYSYTGQPAHLASALSVAEILYTLYMKGVLRHDAQDPQWPGRDRFILSKGHAGLALYATLCMAGYFDEEELYTFCRPGTRLGGEPRLHELPGVEATTGSLGHGLPFGVGVALAQKMDGDGGKTYVVIGDGESQEGSIWEAAMAAPKHGLSNLTVILDYNGLQKMATVNEIMGVESWDAQWRAFGWQVLQADGHDVEDLLRCFAAPAEENKPRMVIARTVKGKGVDMIEHSPDWHYRMPAKRELAAVLENLGITEAELTQCKEHTCWP